MRCRYRGGTGRSSTDLRLIAKISGFGFGLLRPLEFLLQGIDMRVSVCQSGIEGLIDLKAPGRRASATGAGLREPPLRTNPSGIPSPAREPL